MNTSAAPRLESARAAALGLPAFEVWDSLGSTNDRARDLAESGAERGTLVVALEQTEGRGRRGTRWYSGAGRGVWMSVVLSPAEGGLQLPLLVGVACSEALREATGVPVTLKWPNDLVVDDAKLGGVLVERGVTWLVAGVGVNLRSAPDVAELADPPGVGEAGVTETPMTPTAVLDHAGRVPDPVDLAGILARRILDQLDGDTARARGLLAFAELDALRGRAVRTEERGDGIARGIDEDGMLLLEIQDGTVVTVRSGGVRVEPDPSREV